MTFPILMNSNEMAPICKISVYLITDDEEIISDTLILPILPINNVKLSLKFNYEPDKCEKQIELIPKMTTNSTIFLSAIDDRYQIQSYNFINKARALNKISRQNKRQYLKRVLYKDDFYKDNSIKDYPIFNRYINSFDAFHMNDLLLSSSYKINADNYCQKMLLNSSSLMVYREEMYSNKTIAELITVPKDCSNDPEEDLSDFDQASQSMLFYLLHQKNRNLDFYESGHDFAWKTANTAEFEDTFLIANVPDHSGLFNLHAFGLNDKHGLSILDEEVNVGLIIKIFRTIIINYSITAD